MKDKASLVTGITQGACIAALYVVLTLVFAPISFGPVQLRVSEALCILPLFTPAAIPGLFLGCLIANLLGSSIILDVIFGSLATLIGAVAGYMLRPRRWLVPIPAIAANTFIIPFVLKYGYGVVDTAIPILMIQVAIGEALGCYALGELLCSAIMKRNIFLDQNP